MRLTRNDRLIQSRSRLGTYALLGGMVVVIGGFVLSMRFQRYLGYSMIALVLGLILYQIGGYNLRRFGRKQRPDEVLAAELKGFDDRYHFYAWELPAPFVLITPQAVYAFATRDQSGLVTIRDDRFSQRFSFSRIFFFMAQEGMGNPAREAQESAERIEKLIKQDLPNLTAKVQPVVVFVDPKVELDAEDPPIPVLDLKSLRKWLRGSGKGDGAKGFDYRSVEKVLDARAATS